MRSPAVLSPFAQEDDGIERPAKRLRTIPSDPANQAQEVGIMRKTNEDNHVSFLGSASGIHFIRSVYAAIGIKRPGDHGDIPTPERGLVPGEDDRLGSETTDTFTSSIWQPNEATTDPAHMHFTFDDLVSWSQSYFDNWFPAYPFLHAPSILDFFERFASSQGQIQEGDTYALELAILRTIMSISLADRRQLGTTESRPVPSILVFNSFKAAMESVQLALTARTSILSLQAVLCVQLFLLSMLRHNAASRFGGLITRMIYHLGLHRCPARYTAFSTQEVLMRKRIYWSAYCMDRYVNQSLGLPITLRDDDMDVCFLDGEVHGSISKPIELDERLVLLNLLSKHAEVKGLTMELLHKSIDYRQPNHDQSMLVQSKLTKWFNEIEACIDPDDDEQSPFSSFHEMMLTVLKQECIIALNRPLITPSKKSTDHNAALHTCIGAARLTITSLSSFLERCHKPDCKTPVPLLWPSFTWAIWMSNFILVFATIEGELPSKVATKLTEKSLDILKHLSLRGSVWPNACGVAIRELRTRLLEPQSILGTFTEHLTDRRISNHETPSTVSHESRQHIARKLPSENESPTQVFSQDRSAHQRQRRDIGSSRGRPVATDWASPRNTTSIHSGGAGGSYTNFPTSQSNIPNALRSPWEAQPAPDWLENATFAASDQVDLFQGFEIPFWMGDDQYNSLIGNG